MKKKVKKIIAQFYKKIGGRYNRFIDDEVVPHVKIVSAEETLNQLALFIENNQRGVYMRFGDGDIFLYKMKDDGFQKSSDLLSYEIAESLALTGANVLKCLAIHSDLFGYSPGMERGNHKNKDVFALQLFKDSFKFFVGSTIYSPVALHFIATVNPSKANAFLKLLKLKTAIFIGNENVKTETVTLLFGKEIIHIKTPSENAYCEINRIENEAIEALKKLESYSVVCVAMGCSGRPLMKRLWNLNRNIFLFDFGSLLDGIDGNYSRTWLKINTINYSEILKDL